MTLAEQMSADANESPAAKTQSSLAQQMQADAMAASAPKQESTVYSPTGSTMENLAAGFGQGVNSVALGAKQLIDVPATWLEKKFPGISAWAAKSTGLPTAQQSADATQQAIDSVRQTDKPLLDTASGAIGSIGGQAATMMLPLGAVAAYGRAAPAAAALLNPTTYGSAASAGALNGLVQPVATGDSRAMNIGAGAVAGTLGNAVINGVGRLALPVSDALSAAHSKAVQVLDSAGVPLDAAQRTGSAFLNKLRSGFFDNPFTSGTQNELAATQRQAYNQAVLKTVGEDAAAATPDVMSNAQERINGVFKDILDRNNVQVTDTTLHRLSNVQQAATDEEKTPIVNLANRFINALQNDGTVSGQTAYGIKKDLDRLASSADTTLAYHARQLRSTIMDAINGSLNPVDQSAFAQARGQFGNLKTIEGTIDRTGAGDISAAKLANVLSQKRNRGASVYGKGPQDLVDLAQSGNMLLADKTPNSGTTTRLMSALTLPAIGAGVEAVRSGDPVNAAQAAVGMAVLPKLAQTAINNPAVSGYLARGMSGSITPLRDLLLAPQTNEYFGAAAKKAIQLQGAKSLMLQRQ